MTLKYTVGVYSRGKVKILDISNEYILVFRSLNARNFSIKGGVESHETKKYDSQAFRSVINWLSMHR